MLVAHYDFVIVLSWASLECSERRAVPSERNTVFERAIFVVMRMAGEWNEWAGTRSGISLD